MTMILLEVNNRVVEEALTAKYKMALAGAKMDLVDVTFADFDGAMFHISNLDGHKSKILVSISLKSYEDLVRHGVEEVLEKEYSGLLTSPESGYSVSLLLDLYDIPEDWEQMVRKVGLLKRNCFAALFEKFFDLQGEMTAADDDAEESPEAVIGYGRGETLRIQTKSDRVIVAIDTVFREDDDMVIGKVFVQEFREGRKASHTAPQVFFTQSNADGADEDYAGRITFVLLPRHTDKDARSNTIDLLHMFRHYLHYHIKCLKAYIHSRMRAKTNEFLKVLDRALPESKIEKKKKTMSGKTFVRKD